MSLREGSEEAFCGFQLSQSGAATLLDATIPWPKLFLLPILPLLTVAAFLSLLELKLRYVSKTNLLFLLKGSLSFDRMDEE